MYLIPVPLKASEPHHTVLPVAAVVSLSDDGEVSVRQCHGSDDVDRWCDIVRQYGGRVLMVVAGGECPETGEASVWARQSR